MKRFILPVLFICSAFTTQSVSLDYKTKITGSSQQTLTISLNLDQDESIFSNSLHLSTDHPDFTIKQVTIKTDSQEKYLPQFKENHKMYNNSFSVDATIQKTKSSVQSLDQNLYLNFQTYPQLKMEEYTIPVASLASSKNIKKRALSYGNNPSAPRTSRAGSAEKKQSFLAFIQNLTQNTDSLWMKILLAFLLGLLLSLTPCIYPMIPITIGILHQSGKKSIWYNFLGSFSYASGLSTTFAVLGLLAAFAGASFGSALSNPIFVVFIVAFLGYMSLTMIGVVDMYTPGFMKGGAQMNSKLGPFLSTFLFGLISGTIASPCVSPGLALLLTIVATMGSYLFGFALLFMFGIGMSTPLMLIATFSNSMNFLPQSGMWMIEVKRMLGFVMFTMCFYYLNNVVPFSILIWFVALYVLIVALYYIISAQSSQEHKTFKSFLGVALLGLTILLGFKIYESNFAKIEPKKTVATPWVKSYEDALAQARNEGKAVLLDFWANHCSICKAIDYKVFQNERFINATEKSVVLHKVDCTHPTKNIKKLTDQYKVYAQPVILLINPSNEEILKQWTSEPYSMPIDKFVEEIEEAL